MCTGVEASQGIKVLTCKHFLDHVFIRKHKHFLLPLVWADHLRQPDSWFAAHCSDPSTNSLVEESVDLLEKDSLLVFECKLDNKDEALRP